MTFHKIIKLSVSIEIEAAKHRYSVYFITFQDLITQLKKAASENRLDARIKWYCRYKVLIIDELGYQRMDTDSANLFFNLISKRYEKLSTIITTNSPFSKWADIFHEPRLNAFFDTEMEQILCFHTAIDAEKFCTEKSAIFLILPEEDNTKYFMVSLFLQQFYREMLAVADENGGKLPTEW